MLVVARKVGQSILIGEEIEVTVVGVRGDQVRLAVRAPRSLLIQRRDALEQVQQGNVAALNDGDRAAQLLGGSQKPPRVVVSSPSPEKPPSPDATP